MSKITKIPMPENIERIETGSLQFGDDWAGVFIRGDNAVDYANILNEIELKAKNINVINRVNLIRFINLLRSCKQ